MQTDKLKDLVHVGENVFRTPKPTFEKPYVIERFELNKESTKFINSLTPRFGYNGYGEFIFYRTYSRIKKDGSQERWNDCVLRVINGVMSIRKDWYVKHGIKWLEDYWQDYAYLIAITMFKMEWLPPGRGMWAMGTDYIYESGSLSLYNCGFCTMDDIPNDIHWMMDALMNGVGVGFEAVEKSDIKVYEQGRNGKIKLLIDDSREGWCDATKFLLRSYLEEGVPEVELLYNEIRPAGLPIKRFGGISSGPDSLIKFHNDIRKFMAMWRADIKYGNVRLKSDIANCVGCCVVAGNVRRSAELCVGDINDQDFLDLKDYEKYPYRGEHGWMANNTGRLKESKDFEKLPEISNRVIIRGEPGALNQINIKECGRVGKSDNLQLDEAIGLNPCFTGETKVALADGRGSLTFSELVTENKDVAVYCRDEESNKIVIKMMRNPRITGYNQPIYKIHLDDGSIVRATGNHKFKIRNGDYKEVLALVEGDSLEIITKYKASMKTVLGGNGSSSEYIWINNGQRSNKAEHRLIAEFNYGKLGSKVVHHKDNDSLNNRPDNLEPMVKEDHDKLHLERMQGFNNPMCQEHSEEWYKNYHDSMSKATSGLKNGRALQISNERIEEICLEETIKIGRKLSLLEWHNICNQFNIPHCFQNYRKQFLGTPAELIKRCATRCGFNANVRINSEGIYYNHKVVKVEFDCNEDVYNGTVDEFHNYYVGGFKNENKEVFINVKNCGEIPLCPFELCNVNDTYPTVSNTDEDWLKSCEHATLYCSTVALLPTHRMESNRIIAKNRRIGVGIVDYTGWKKEKGVARITRLMREGYKTVRKTNKELAQEAGIPESIRVTTVKPGGTGPKLPGKTSGIGHPTFDYTIRRTRIQMNSPMFSFLHKHNIPHEPDLVSANTEVFDYPILQGPARPADEVTLWEQAMNLVLVQREWADNAVSNTLYFRPKWRLVLSRQPKNLEEYEFLLDESLIQYNFGFNYFSLDYYKTQELILNEEVKIKTIYNEETNYCSVEIYEYDVGHEEQQIEEVLSSIMPLIKSVSLLPHSDKGSYLQMPEEGITKEQYDLMLSMIIPMDWSKFEGGTDGVDEKYCSGPQCELPQKP